MYVLKVEWSCIDQERCYDTHRVTIYPDKESAKKSFKKELMNTLQTRDYLIEALFECCDRIITAEGISDVSLERQIAEFAEKRTVFDYYDGEDTVMIAYEEAKFFEPVEFRRE